MSLDSDFFIGNRKKLRELFGGTAPIVIAGNSLMQKSGDTTYPFSQETNFWYLTGVKEPGLILVLEVDNVYLILPKGSDKRDTFDGPLDNKEIKAKSGISKVFAYDEGWKQLSGRLIKVKHVATLQPPQSFIDSEVMFTNPARRRLIKQIKEHNPEVSLIDIRSILTNMRSVKQPQELELIERALDETASIFKLIEKKRTTAMSENILMAEVEKHMRINNLSFAYDPIIASGRNALTLHYSKNNAPIDASKFLLIDIGASFQNYNADITRTVVSAPSKRQKLVYNAVLAVQNYAFTLLKPGITLKTYEQEVFKYMGEKLRELGLIKTISSGTVRKYYPHLTSHFLGIDVHDVGDPETPLVTGMVLTVEPGIYIDKEDIGIRTEDVVVITETGNRILSSRIPKTIDKFY